MSKIPSGAVPHGLPKRHGGAKLHPLPLRIMHWFNAFAMLMMITSGWGIYDDDAIFGWLYFPDWIRLGSWAATSLLWHFAAMWLLMVNGLFYLVYGLATGTVPAQAIARPNLGAHRHGTRGRCGSTSPTMTSPAIMRWQKLLYIVVILAGVSQVATGFAIWKPVQFSWLTALFGGFQGARLAHFIGMSVIVGFVVVHVALALLVPKTLWAMLTGGPRVKVQA